MIFFPKNEFQQLVSNSFERMLPTLQYFVWNPITRYARNSGWTEQEKCYQNFFRGGFMMYHSLAQSMHPHAYNERSRADNFFRRVETILPGIQVPDWAHHNKRAVDIDFEGALNPFRALNIVDQEATPKPHYGLGYPSSISHIGNYRQIIGYYAQRIFFNENLRGNSTSGYYSDDKEKTINSWYANAENRNILNIKNLQSDELNVMKFQAEKWIKNIDQYFPEYRNISEPNTTQIVFEPYLERSALDICNYIFINKWIEANESKVFTQEEYQKIYEFYLHQEDHSFWKINPDDGLYVATPLYEKFVKALNIPNVFDLKKYTARVVEQQYKDSLMSNYNITMNTIEQFRKQHQKIINELNIATIDGNVSAMDLKRLRMYVTEEVYNPLFKRRLRKYASDAKDSMVLELFNKHGIDVLIYLEKEHAISKDELYFMNKDIQENFMIRVKNIVSTFHFKPIPNTVTNYE